MSTLASLGCNAKKPTHMTIAAISTKSAIKKKLQIGSPLPWTPATIE
jgi:hypothetical protein